MSYSYAVRMAERDGRSLGEVCCPPATYSFAVSLRREDLGAGYACAAPARQFDHAAGARALCAATAYDGRRGGPRSRRRSGSRRRRRGHGVRRRHRRQGGGRHARGPWRSGSPRAPLRARACAQLPTQCRGRGRGRWRALARQRALVPSSAAGRGGRAAWRPRRSPPAGGVRTAALGERERDRVFARAGRAATRCAIGTRSKAWRAEARRHHRRRRRRALRGDRLASAAAQTVRAPAPRHALPPRARAATASSRSMSRARASRTRRFAGRPAATVGRLRRARSRRDPLEARGDVLRASAALSRRAAPTLFAMRRWRRADRSSAGSAQLGRHGRLGCERSDQSPRERRAAPLSLDDAPHSATAWDHGVRLLTSAIPARERCHGRARFARARRSAGGGSAHARAQASTVRARSRAGSLSFARDEKVFGDRAARRRAGASSDPMGLLDEFGVEARHRHADHRDGRTGTAKAAAGDEVRPVRAAPPPLFDAGTPFPWRPPPRAPRPWLRACGSAAAATVLAAAPRAAAARARRAPARPRGRAAPGRPHIRACEHSPTGAPPPAGAAAHAHRAVSDAKTLRRVARALGRKDVLHERRAEAAPIVFRALRRGHRRRDDSPSPARRRRRRATVSTAAATAHPAAVGARARRAHESVAGRGRRGRRRTRAPVAARGAPAGDPFGARRGVEPWRRAAWAARAVGARRRGRRRARAGPDRARGAAAIAFDVARELGALRAPAGRAGRRGTRRALESRPTRQRRRAPRNKRAPRPRRRRDRAAARGAVTRLATSRRARARRTRVTRARRGRRAPTSRAEARAARAAEQLVAGTSA